MVALLLFGVGCALVAYRPGVWLFMVPALLPILNFSPWSGWLVFDELDILLLGVLAGGYGRMACSPAPLAGWAQSRLLLGLAALWAGDGLLALYRGFLDAGGFAFDWYAGYADAFNSVRVFKSQGFALLLIPLLQRELERGVPRACRRLAGGIVAGLTVVTLVAVWERALFPGLLDFSTNYRTVALFWEMHVGGAAMDAYLALAAPFAAWAVVRAPRPLLWGGAAALALLTGYTLLTTFARGAYLAVALSLMLLAVLLRAQRRGVDAAAWLGDWWRRVPPGGWRGRAMALLVLALLAEMVVVLGGGTFMMERLGSTDSDLSSRTRHWQHGMGLLRGHADWLLGKGLGRMPANYAGHVAQGEFSGDVAWHAERLTQGRVNRFVTLRGPATNERLGGQFALTQRVAVEGGPAPVVRLDVRVRKVADVQVELCERHLLYDGRCQVRFVRVFPVSAGWQVLEFALQGPALGAGAVWRGGRSHVFSLSVVNAAGVADIDNVSLSGASARRILRNGDFSGELAHWFAAAQSYFLPWHIDNLFLELLIERGVLGLLIFTALVGAALWQLVRGRARTLPMAPYLAASLCAALLVGAVSSVLDVPRVAFLLQFLVLFSIQTGIAGTAAGNPGDTPGDWPGNAA